MKIAYCIGSLAKPGGTEKVLATKSKYLAEVLNYDIFIYILDQKGQPLCYEFSPKVKIIDIGISSKSNFPKIPGITYFIVLKKLNKIFEKKFREINPDYIIVLERGYYDFFIPYNSHKAPKIREFHFSEAAVRSRAVLMKNPFKKLRYLLLYNLIFRQFKKYYKIVLLTESDRKSSKYGNNTTVIPNMIETSSIKRNDNTSSNVISIGSMNDHRKGFDKQIKMWVKIKQLHPNWKLNIYGDGKLFNYYQNLIKEKGLEGHVFLHGRTENIYEKLSQSSIFILTSLAEGYPMVLIEALSAGVPCIAYDCPTGPSDIISPNEDGFVIKMNDQENFISKLNYMISNPSIRVKMSQNALKNSSRFTPSKIMPLWVQLFNQKNKENENKNHYLSQRL